MLILFDTRLPVVVVMVVGRATKFNVSSRGSLSKITFR